MIVQSDNPEEIVDLIMDNQDKRIDVQIGDAIYTNVKPMTASCVLNAVEVE